jgi:hypothetical protein
MELFEARLSQFIKVATFVLIGATFLFANPIGKLIIFIMPVPYDGRCLPFLIFGPLDSLDHYPLLWQGDMDVPMCSSKLSQLLKMLLP